MTAIIVVVGAVVMAMIGSEVALRGAKLQTGLPRTLAVWGTVYVLAACWALEADRALLIPFTIFWGGAFLSWFGVRSHIESSILLRMLLLLRQQPRQAMPGSRLVVEYTRHYGESVRIDELCRAGLAVRSPESTGAIRVTPKGRTVLRVVARLR